MKKQVNWLAGYCRLTLAGAAPQAALNRLTARHVPFWDVQFADEFTASVSLRRRDVKVAKKEAERAQCIVEQAEEKGAPKRYRGLRRRIVLIIMLACAVLAAIVIPKFVWMYEVEGNVNVPREKIIRAVREAGVGVGTYGPNIVPQDVKNMVLVMLPELRWLTVTQNGGCAVIHVRERKRKPAILDRRTPQNVVASRDGLITDVSVYEGTPVCKKGDTVTAGQLLISGYVDWEYKTQVCGALGEVYARTWRASKLRIPETYLQKGAAERTKNVYFLRIGRRRIKISVGSGILHGICDKMTTYRNLTLPHGFTLPISLICERYVLRASSEKSLGKVEAEKIAKDWALRTAKENMIAGTVDKTYYHLVRRRGVWEMDSTLECTEMIARRVRAEIFKGDEIDD